jgi:hypothetical protein
MGQQFARGDVVGVLLVEAPSPAFVVADPAPPELDQLLELLLPELIGMEEQPDAIDLPCPALRAIGSADQLRRPVGRVRRSSSS